MVIAIANVIFIFTFTFIVSVVAIVIAIIAQTPASHSQWEQRCSPPLAPSGRL